MVLDERFSTSWEDYSNGSPSSGWEERDVFRRRLYCQRRRLIYPPPIFAQTAIDEIASATCGLLEVVASIPERIFGGDYQRWMEFLGISGPEAELVID